MVAQFVNSVLIGSSVATLLLVTASALLLGATSVVLLPREPKGRGMDDDLLDDEADDASDVRGRFEGKAPPAYGSDEPAF